MDACADGNRSRVTGVMETVGFPDNTGSQLVVMYAKAATGAAFGVIMGRMPLFFKRLPDTTLPGAFIKIRHNSYL
jgi:hypothetical protein